MIKTITITALLLAATPAMAQYLTPLEQSRRDMERIQDQSLQMLQQTQQQQRQQLQQQQMLNQMQQQRTCTSSCVGGVCRTVCN
jgi:hypothetical protein